MVSDKMSTQGMDLRDCGEHALVDGEQEIRDQVAGDGRSAQDIPESEVGERTDEGAGVVRKCQGEAPKKPLEGYDGGSHYGEP
jgi:hypothetical protein